MVDLANANIVTLMESYIETSKETKRIDGHLCSVLFFFYKDEEEPLGYRVEPVGFQMTSLKVKNDIQKTANKKSKSKGLVAVGFLEEIYYRSDVGGDHSDSPLSSDPDSMSAIYICLFFANKAKMVEKTIFFKNFGENDPEDVFDESMAVHNIAYVEQAWNSSQNPTTPQLINPFVGTEF